MQRPVHGDQIHRLINHELMDIALFEIQALRQAGLLRQRGIRPYTDRHHNQIRLDLCAVGETYTGADGEDGQYYVAFEAIAADDDAISVTCEVDLCVHAGEIRRSVDEATPEGILVYDEGGVTVRAFRVDHSPVEPAVGQDVEFAVAAGGRDRRAAGGRGGGARRRRRADGHAAHDDPGVPWAPLGVLDPDPDLVETGLRRRAAESSLQRQGQPLPGATEMSLVAYDFRAEDFVREERSEERRVGKECRSRWSPYH